MKNQKTLLWLIGIIIILALVASVASFAVQTEGEPYPFTNHRGETVMINGHGLYYYDTVSIAAQMQGNDIVTLVLGLPLLVIATWFSQRGSLRGRLLLSGTLGFFLYTYMSMSFLTAYNDFFLVYVALFSLSLFAFVLSMMNFDLGTLSNHFPAKMPRGWISGVLFFGGGFLLLAWLARILSPLFQNQTPVLENLTTLGIQTMDLGMVVPLSFVAGILLLRRSVWGYLLSTVALMKGMTLGLAVSAMAINMALQGVAVSPMELIAFPLIATLNITMTILLLRSIRE